VNRQRHTPEQIIGKLRTAEQMLSEGKPPGEAAKALEVSELTLHGRRVPAKAKMRRRLGGHQGKTPTWSPSTAACVTSCWTSRCSPLWPRRRSWPLTGVRTTTPAALTRREECSVPPNTRIYTT